MLTRFAEQRLDPHDVSRKHLGRWNEPRQPECPLHRLKLRPDRRADRDVVKNLAAQSIRDFGAAFGHAANLEIDARRELLQAKARLETAADDRLEQRVGRPPECAQVRLRRRVGNRGDRVAHRLAAFFLPAQPRQQTALVHPALLDEKRCELCGCNGFTRGASRRARA